MKKKILLNLFLVLTLVLSFTLLVGCNKNQDSDGDGNQGGDVVDSHVYSFIAPSGTPSLALSTLFDNNPQVKYEIVAGANPLVAALTSGSHDFIVAPVNVGAKLYANNQKYKLVKTIVWGNFYIASLSEIDSIEDFLIKE